MRSLLHLPLDISRAVTKIIANGLGYEVRRIIRDKDLVWAPPGADPITYEYNLLRRGGVLFEIPLTQVRSFDTLAYPLEGSRNPFVRAVCAALKNDPADPRPHIENVLRAYYRTVAPTTALEVVGLDASDAPGLELASPVEWTFPWEARTRAEAMRGWSQAAIHEGLQNLGTLDLNSGMTIFGPVKSSKLSMEVSRLCRLHRSVVSRGFNCTNPRDPLGVCAFRRGSDYRWMIQAGQHRFAVAKAHGLESIPAVITNVVRRADAQYWPNVVNGTYTENGATTLFDRMFDGISPIMCRDWISRKIF